MQSYESILLVGENSFIGKNIKQSIYSDQFKFISGYEDPTTQDLTNVSCVVNCSYDCRLSKEEYQENYDLDLKWFNLAKQNNIQFIMISSRRVYSKQSQFGATEMCYRNGLDYYGKNKIITEKTLIKEQSPLTVLRASNIIGMEYPRNRPSMMGYLMKELKEKQYIQLTECPFAYRDCIPVERFIDVLVFIAKNNINGIYNIGAGFPVMIGQIALWLIEGYGQGELRCSVSSPGQSFYLNCDKIKSVLPFNFNENDLKQYCIDLGKQLAQKT